MVMLAKDFGKIGHTFAIFEEDMRVFIERRLQEFEQNGKLYEHQLHIQEQFKEKVKRPNPVQGIEKSRTYRVRYYDPSMKLDRDLVDHKGHVFARKGTTINPLEQVVLSTTMVFIDGDDASQVTWAVKQKDAKIVLVKGSPLLIERENEKPIYFDQGGRICQKWGITRVPTRVSQAKNRLKMEEVPLNDQ